MNAKYTSKVILAFLLLSLTLACSKQELASPDPSKVIQLTITGASTANLEFIFNDKVVASTNAPGTVSVKTLLPISGQEADIQIREKGKTKILQHRKLTAVPYNQEFSIYYDGTKLFDTAIAVIIKGYAVSGELEFLLEGNVIYSGTGIINTTDNPVVIPIDKGTTREIAIRQKGETAILGTKTISSDPKQSIGLFFDGTNLVNNVQLEAPVNPANMLISARFESVFPAYFKNVDVDLVCYVRNTTANTNTKTNPELRFTIPKGQFAKIELPALPGPSPQYVYSFDIYEKGTNTVPYNSSSAPFIPNGFPLKQNEGFSGGTISFEAGKSMLVLIKDNRTIKTTVPRATYLSGVITDLSQYFQ